MKKFLSLGFLILSLPSYTQSSAEIDLRELKSSPSIQLPEPKVVMKEYFQAGHYTRNDTYLSRPLIPASLISKISYRDKVGVFNGVVMVEATDGNEYVIETHGNSFLQGQAISTANDKTKVMNARIKELKTWYGPDVLIYFKPTADGRFTWPEVEPNWLRLYLQFQQVQAKLNSINH
jgi:hypothetical protein